MTVLVQSLEASEAEIIVSGLLCSRTLMRAASSRVRAGAGHIREIVQSLSKSTPHRSAQWVTGVSLRASNTSTFGCCGDRLCSSQRSLVGHLRVLAGHLAGARYCRAGSLCILYVLWPACELKSVLGPARVANWLLQN